MTLLIAANAGCVALAISIVYYAFRGWPVRYANGTLSWAITAFFVAFVALTIVGSIATALYHRSKSHVTLRLAEAPAVVAAGGLLMGLLKQTLTGDF